MQLAQRVVPCGVGGAKLENVHGCWSRDGARVAQGLGVGQAVTGQDLGQMMRQRGLAGALVREVQQTDVDATSSVLAEAIAQTLPGTRIDEIGMQFVAVRLADECPWFAQQRVDAEVIIHLS